MIEKFKISNFKNLKIGKEIELKKINILIGANGSGKSNFIDGIIFFKDLIEKGLQESIAKRKYEELLNKYSDVNSFDLSISLNTEAQYSTLKYKLSIFVKELKTFILEESIMYDKPLDKSKEQPFRFIHCHGKFSGKCSFPIKEKGKTKSRHIKVSNFDTVFRQYYDLTKYMVYTQKFFPTFSKVIDDIKEYVKKWRYFPMSDINLDELKKPLKITGNTNILYPNMSNIGDFLIKSRYTNKEFLQRLKDYFKTDIDFEIQPSGEYINIFPILNGKKFYMSSLSDGQIRLLILLSIFYLDENSKVVFIDEPELNLHPSWLRKLREDIYNSKKQIIISTHSSDLLDTFTEDFRNELVNIIVFENGKVELLKKSKALEKEIEKGYELGDLYRMGDPVIGGWGF